MRHEAILELYPNVVMVDDGAGAIGIDGNPVEVDEDIVTARVEELEKERGSKAYQMERMLEYPPIEDYLDGVVKGDDAQIQEYIDKCNAVKAKYPKPEET